MARMKARELWDKTDEELAEMIRNSQQELFNLRFQLTTGQQQNTARAREVRKEMARIKTVLRQRQLIEEFEGESGNA